MAFCLGRPLIPSVGIQISRSTHVRWFSVVQSQWADDRWGTHSQQPRQAAERSVKVTAKEMGLIPNDVGLFERTFIYPSSKNRPRFFHHPLNFIRFNWLWAKSKVWGRLSLLFHSNFRTNLRLIQTAPTAVALHHHLNTAIAEGDTAFLRERCAEGLQQKAQAMIFSRPKGEIWHWELIKYNQRPKVMMHRAASLPLRDGGLRQAVVRISSRQRLTRYTRDGTVVAGSGKEKDTVEYFVIQRRMVKKVEEPWRIWGTTLETTLDILDQPEPGEAVAGSK